MAKVINDEHRISHVGIYPLCHMNVDLYVMPNRDGGTVLTRPDDVCLPRILVGLDYHTWEDVVAVFLHEVIEFALIYNQTRYEPSDKSVRDFGGFVFHFTHAQFTTICEHASQFVTAALPDLSVAYKKHRKKKR